MVMRDWSKYSWPMWTTLPPVIVPLASRFTPVWTMASIGPILVRYERGCQRLGAVWREPTVHVNGSAGIVAWKECVKGGNALLVSELDASESRCVDDASIVTLVPIGLLVVVPDAAVYALSYIVSFRYTSLFLRWVRRLTVVLQPQTSTATSRSGWQVLTSTT